MIMDRFNIPDDVPIESKLVTRQILSAQTQLEQQNAEIRKNVLKYDEVLNKQRLVIYAERKKVLEGADLHEQIRHMISDIVEAYVAGATSEGYAEDWDLDQMFTAFRQLYPMSFTLAELEEELGSREAMDAEFLTERIKTDALGAYDKREAELGEDATRELERQVLLSVLDRKWREHLYEMDYLQEGIGLRAYAQRDPLVEYQREGFDLFGSMMEGIKEESVGFLFNLEVQVADSEDIASQAAETPEHPVEIRAKGLGHRAPEQLQYTAPAIDGEAGAGAPVIQSGPLSPTAAGAKQADPGQKVGGETPRNAPCPCGSGRKYKRCHGSPTPG
jgi:preprotein translocase subunit SecA